MVFKRNLLTKSKHIKSSRSLIFNNFKKVAFIGVAISLGALFSGTISSAQASVRNEGDFFAPTTSSLFDAIRLFNSNQKVMLQLTGDDFSERQTIFTASLGNINELTIKGVDSNNNPFIRTVSPVPSPSLPFSPLFDLVLQGRIFTIKDVAFSGFSDFSAVPPGGTTTDVRTSSAIIFHGGTLNYDVSNSLDTVNFGADGSKINADLFSHTDFVKDGMGTLRCVHKNGFIAKHLIVQNGAFRVERMQTEEGQASGPQAEGRQISLAIGLTGADALLETEHLKINKQSLVDVNGSIVVGGNGKISMESTDNLLNGMSLELNPGSEINFELDLGTKSSPNINISGPVIFNTNIVNGLYPIINIHLLQENLYDFPFKKTFFLITAGLIEDDLRSVKVNYIGGRGSYQYSMDIVRTEGDSSLNILELTVDNTDYECSPDSLITVHRIETAYNDDQANKCWGILMSAKREWGGYAALFHPNINSHGALTKITQNLEAIASFDNTKNGYPSYMQVAAAAAGFSLNFNTIRSTLTNFGITNQLPADSAVLAELRRLANVSKIAGDLYAGCLKTYQEDEISSLSISQLLSVLLTKYPKFAKSVYLKRMSQDNLTENMIHLLGNNSLFLLRAPIRKMVSYNGTDLTVHSGQIPVLVVGYFMDPVTKELTFNALTGGSNIKYQSIAAITARDIIAATTDVWAFVRAKIKSDTTVHESCRS